MSDTTHNRSFICHHPSSVGREWSACGVFAMYCTRARKPENVVAQVNCKNCIALMNAGKPTKYYIPRNDSK